MDDDYQYPPVPRPTVFGKAYREGPRGKQRTRKLTNRVRRAGVRSYAEIGIDTGFTSAHVADALPDGAEMHLFDYQDIVEPVCETIEAEHGGRLSIYGHGNSRKLNDSYAWTLGRMLQHGTAPKLDYVYIDGAHTWAIDGFAFLLIDRMLVDGGHVEFDDFRYRLTKSNTMNPAICPLTAALYTDEQARTSQVEMLIRVLVDTDERYTEVVPRRVYGKSCGGD
jgi:hypothetical protein